MTTPITALPITGFTISDLPLVSPSAGQSLEVGGSSDGRVDIDALVTYVNSKTPTLIFLGAWDVAASYNAGNVVTYLGGAYTAISAPPVATLPSDDSYWQQIAAPGATGPAGPQGAAGADGIDGTDGKTILSGSGAPSAGLGVDGDYYLDTVASDFYGPKTAGAWGSPVSLIGPAGANGINGTDGTDGQPGLGIRYSFSTTTTAPPASGELRFNNVAYASVTAIYAHETARTGVDASSILGSLSAGSVLMIFDEVSDAAYAFYELVSSVDDGAYRTLTVTHLGSVGTLGANVSLGFSVAGVQGPTGATGSVSSASTINLTEQGATPTTPAAGTWELYAKAAGIYALDDAGNETLLGSSTVAWGDVTGTLADQTDLQTALDAKAPLTPDINAQIGTTYTLALGDAHGLVTMDNADANTLTIPTNASVAFPTGTVIEVWQLGAGSTTIEAATGVTLNGVSAGGVTLGAAYAPATLRKIGTDAWIIAVGGAANVA